jgi:hypothetical protein
MERVGELESTYTSFLNTTTVPVLGMIFQLERYRNGWQLAATMKTRLEGG